MIEEIVPFKGWERNLRLANEHLELIVTLEVGPRILSLSPRAGRNIFKVFEEQSGSGGEAQWKSRGGHRLWLAPETLEVTYYPDNAPVAYENEGEAVLLSAPPEATGFQKQLRLTLHPQEARVEIVHRVTNIGAQSRRLALWALSVMEAGGVAIVPQPPRGQHPRDLLPNRALILWPYSDLRDPRLHLGSRFITLRQERGREPFKIGLAGETGQAAYWLDGTLFVKRFAFQADAVYPDMGCNCELFTNEKMLEVESLGPLHTIEPGEVVEHREEWRLWTDVPPFDAAVEEEIGRSLPPLLERENDQ